MNFHSMLRLKCQKKLFNKDAILFDFEILEAEDDAILDVLFKRIISYYSSNSDAMAKIVRALVKPTFLNNSGFFTDVVMAEIVCS